MRIWWIVWNRAGGVAILGGVAGEIRGATMHTTTLTHPCGHEVRGRNRERITPQKQAHRLAIGSRCSICRAKKAAGRTAAAREQEQREQAAAAHVDAVMVAGSATLLALGFAVEHVSDSGSLYFVRGSTRVRLSDHLVPETGDRLKRRDELGSVWSHDFRARARISTAALRSEILAALL